MDEEYSENYMEIVGSENQNSNKIKNQNSSLDQNSTEANNTNGLQNKNLKFDEIPIKPAANNFLELLEKNLENNDYNDYYENEDNENKRKIKYEPRRKKEVKFDLSNQKKYKYYSQKFDKNFGKDVDGLDNFDKIDYNENNNSKKKTLIKYDKMRNNSSSSVNKNVNKKENSVNNNSNRNHNANNKTKGILINLIFLVNFRFFLFSNFINRINILYMK